MKIALELDVWCRSKQQLFYWNFHVVRNLFKVSALIKHFFLQILNRLKGINWWVFINPILVIFCEELNIRVGICNHFSSWKTCDQDFLKFLFELIHNDVDNVADYQKIFQNNLCIMASRQPLKQDVQKCLALNLILALLFNFIQSSLS